jgi:hypothetical protein
VKRVGVSEFSDHVVQYLSGDEPVAIERNGEPLGFYIPAGPANPTNAAEALERLEQAVRHVLDETGLSEDELSRLYDLTERLPARARAGRRSATPSRHAAGR